MWHGADGLRLRFLALVSCCWTIGIEGAIRSGVAIQIGGSVLPASIGQSILVTLSLCDRLLKQIHELVHGGLRLVDLVTLELCSEVIVESYVG